MFEYFWSEFLLHDKILASINYYYCGIAHIAQGNCVFNQIWLYLSVTDCCNWLIRTIDVSIITDDRYINICFMNIFCC